MDDTLGQRLKTLRETCNLTQGDVAILTGVSKKSISSYENDLRQPSYEILIRLAHIYKVSLDYLLGNLLQRLYYGKRAG